MKKNREKLLEILGTRFGDDPKALQAVHKAIAADYDKRLGEVETKHQEAIKDIKADHKAELARRDQEATKRHQEALKAIREAKNEAVQESRDGIRESEGKNEEKMRGSISELLTRLDKRYGTRLDDHWKRIERFSEFAVGAPNRSIYLAGLVISGRYSDVNLIAGSNVTITESDNETTHMADVTFSATGGGGGSGFQRPTSGVVNGVNTIYTWATAPNVIVVDNGNAMQQTSSDGTANWSGTTTTTLLTSIPNDDIYSPA